MCRRRGKFEVAVAGFRIDAVSRGRLIEIQHGSLAAIRDKLRVLLAHRRVLLVKPIVASKVLSAPRRMGRCGPRAAVPNAAKLLDLFDELVHFTGVFPHRRLTLDVLLVDIEEWRYPGHGRRRRWREADHEVEDQKLVAVRTRHRFRTAADLAALVPARLARRVSHGRSGGRLGRAAARAQASPIASIAWVPWTRGQAGQCPAVPLEGPKGKAKGKRKKAKAMQLAARRPEVANRGSARQGPTKVASGRWSVVSGANQAAVSRQEFATKTSFAGL